MTQQNPNPTSSSFQMDEDTLSQIKQQVDKDPALRRKINDWRIKMSKFIKKNR